MQINEIKQEFYEVSKILEDVKTMVDYESLKMNVEELDRLTYVQGFWDDVTGANKVIKQLKDLKSTYVRINDFFELFEEIKMVYELLILGEDMDEEYLQLISDFKEQAELLSVELLLVDDNDKLNAVIEIHPGAGGTESQDWAEMLFRMYKRYGENHQLEFELIDYLDGEEAGIKSVTFCLRGTNSYGYLKTESGVHRLVRISPFDSGGRRHTSFASVSVYPEIDDTIEVEINESDLKIDTFRSGGAGGQSVNTTDSAVRITHLPTNLIVNVQNERSQIKNRAKAIQILKSKIYQLELEKQQAETFKNHQANVSNSFGSQIRSYVMHPYSMVKDHRTNIETGNVAKVLDGDVNMFIYGYLKMMARGDLDE